MKVRLNDEEINIIKKLTEEIFGKSEVYIFGSRTDMSKKGGDLDIFIIPENNHNLFKKKIKLSSKLEHILGIPVDVVVDRGKDTSIKKEAVKGIRIC